jgi:hypothetical protein
MREFSQGFHALLPLVDHCLVAPAPLPASALSFLPHTCSKHTTSSHLLAHHLLPQLRQLSSQLRSQQRCGSSRFPLSFSSRFSATSTAPISRLHALYQGSYEITLPPRCFVAWSRALDISRWGRSRIFLSALCFKGTSKRSSLMDPSTINTSPTERSSMRG